MTEQQFSDSRKGQVLATILEQPAAIQRIIASSRDDRPAVEAIDNDVAELIGPLTDSEKQAAGRIVKRILGSHGLRPFKKGQRVLGGQIFSRGTVYREYLPSAAALAITAAPSAVHDRIVAARAILASAKRDPSETPASVDDFLVDRRSLWGGN